MSTATLDQERLDAFMGRVVGELGATFNAVLVGIGDRLGLYRRHARRRARRPPAELARRTGTYERLVREWLNAPGRRRLRRRTTPSDDTYRLAPEQAFALLDLDLPGAFRLDHVDGARRGRHPEAFRSGRGFGWHEHDHGLFEGTERFFRPGYQANLVTAWLPALEGVEAKLRAGARVADLGCGHGVVDDPDGRGVPRVDVRRHGLPRGLDRRRAGAGTRGRRRRPRPLRGRDGRGADGRPVRPRDAVRLPARHGRPDGRRARHPRAHRARRHADGGRAARRRPRRGQPQPRRAAVLLRVDGHLHAGLAVPAAAARRWAPRPASRASRAVLRAAGFGHVRRAAETPFNMVLEARP